MFKPSQVSLAIAAVVAASVLPAFAQSADAQLERVVVTGSNIKRISGEGPLPVEIITRADIEKKGVTSTNDLLRSMASMSSFNDELTSNSPSATGTASAGFRGLGGDQTVVLLNGRRLANYGFDGAFVNLNTIPLGAIERVEVLKDGAAAIYGADAIGGVINFITRRDFSGFEATAGFGQSSRGDSTEKSVTLTAGYGNYEQQGFNILANLNYSKRDRLMNLDRERTRTADYRRFGGGNQLSTFAPSGNFVNPKTKLQDTFSACPDAGLVVSPSPLSPGVAGSKSCVFDFAPYRTTMFPAERLGGVVTGSLKISSDHRLFAEAIYAKSESFASAAPAPGNILIKKELTALNPFGVDLTVRGRPLQAGPRTTNNVAEASRFLLGADGSLFGWDYNVAAGQAKNKVVNEDGGYMLTDKLLAAIGDGTFNPFVNNNPQSVVDSLVAKDQRKGETTYSFIDGRVSGELGQLPGGAIGLATGFTIAQDKIDDVPGPNQSKAGPIQGQSNVFGSITQSAVNADRKMGAVFAELALPITKQIEAQVAVRHDRYQGGINSTTPKFALSYRPLGSLLFRASYAEGFKMPSLRDLNGGQNQSADSVQDFPGCDANKVAKDKCPRLQYDRYSGGNTSLRPEKAKTMNFGVMFEPNNSVNLGLDYFIIEKKDEIGLVPTQFVIDNVPFVKGATTLLNGDPKLSVTRNAGGTITAINTTQDNLGTRNIEGFDLTGTLRLPLAEGVRLTFGGNATYYSKYDYADMPGTPLYGRLGLLNLPRWKTVATASLKVGDFEGTVTRTDIAEMWDKPQSTAATPVASTDKTIANFAPIDLGISYVGFKGIRLSGGVKNLFDIEPGFSNNDSRTLGFAQVHDIRGRFYYASIGYSFK